MVLSSYWKRRAVAVENMRNKRAKETIQNVVVPFDKAQAQIEKEINAWYVRFAENNEIDLVEAKKLLNTKELKEFRWDVKEYIKYGRENAVDQLWMKELENASARFHISRLEALKIRAQNAAEVAFGNELDQIDQMAARVYMDDYYHTAYEIQRGLGIGWDVSQIDQKKLDKILSKPWTADKMTFSDRIWKSKTQLIDSLHTELTQMCVLGKSPDQAISNIAKRMNVSKNQAGRLVMTESAYFGSAAQKDCFNDLDVEKFEVIATLDNKTSEICQEMDGKVFDMKDFEAGVTAPPFHVWCRSCTAPWFEDEDGERAARNAEGQTYYVPSSMKYDDWKKTFVDGGSKDDLTDFVKSDILNKPVKSNEEHYKKLVEGLENKGVEYRPVESHKSTLSPEEIIQTLGGGDQTRGSCASVGLAYVGQKQGWNVLDFRDGKSRQFFASSSNLKELSQIKGIKALTAEGASSMTVANRLLKMCEVGKEYYLATGRHAAIVRKLDDAVYQYLELQSRDSGWKNFDGNPRYTLKTRFGCRQTSDSAAYYDFMIDLNDSDFATDEFRSLLGFLNTATDAQKKGVGGYAK